MHRHGERLGVGDRVELPRDDAHGVVLEVLDRGVERTFRDGRLEVHEVCRYCVLLATGRTVVVNDRHGRIRRLGPPAAVVPPPPPGHAFVAGPAARPAPARATT